METNCKKLTYLGLPRSVYVIFFARVVNSIGNFVFPFMTLLLTSKGGMGEQQVGLFLLIASVLQVPGSLLGGKLTDIMGRKKIMILFMGLAALCFIPCAFLIDSKDAFQYLPWFLILAAFFGSVAGPASGAMMNDLTLPENRQAAFSLLYMGMNVGTAIGSIVAGFLFNNYMKLLFIGDAVTTLISIMLLLFLVKETKPTNEEIDKIMEERVDEKAETGGLLAALLRRPSLLIFASFDIIYSFVYEQTRFSLPLQTKAVFGEVMGATYFGTFNMVNCIEVIFFTTVITILTRKLRAIYNVSIAGIFFAVGFGMLFFVKSFWMFVLSTIIWTIGEIINATNIGVYIANHTPISHRGRFNSIIHIITGTGSAISPYVMGGFIAAKGVNNVWPVIFFLSLTAAFSMFILGTFEKRRLSRTMS
ncbi:MAG: major facilitator superfamily protein [Herbinix sp.]|nr:major facilitator superfamily protein [Herbinix sp.]